ncbi:pleckstrin homology domain-containing family M member 1-like isoform X2 [Haliotis cracherodii]|uniref:pleckstrin homology domain-containing family M member 1-like isoform X2 n=1 Tax=Haliotis cracherodii TaxID=6455 RepID=UPI0039E81B50
MLSQMNMFKKKGPSQQEVIHETKLKRNISKEFSKVLKVLQHRHTNDENEVPIYSDDEANSLCNILEAVFLHGLKDSVASKLVSYMNFSTPAADSAVTVNFWNFVVKFTHKDVISQLKKLPQISTDIGLCRAWVRLALNDGLMESYVDSVVADAKTLQYFYNTTAYLRDHEHPGILKSYLSGLMTLTFQLSFNSSVLNDWMSTPLVLAGFVDSQTPTPIFTVKPGAGKKPISEDKSSLQLPPRTARSKSHDRDRLDNSQIVSSPLDGLRTPPNTPYDMQGFTRADVEAIKKMAMASSPYAASECSTSSHISCPDPSNGNAPSLDPSLIEDQILQEIMAQNAADLRNVKDGTVLRKSAEKEVFERSPKTERKPDANDVQKSPKVKRKTDQDCVKDVENSVPAAPTEELMSSETTNVDLNSKSCDTLVGESEELCDTDRDGQTDGAVSELTIPQPDVLDIYAQANSSTEKLPPLRASSELPPLHHFTPPVSPSRRKSGPVEPVLSSVVASEIVTAPIMERRRSSLSAIQELISKNAGRSAPSSSDVHVYDSATGANVPMELAGSPKTYGNRLSDMTGWSSEFEHSGEYLSERNLARFEASTEEISRRKKTESFRTLLKNYAPSSSHSPGPSLDQVIQNLPISSVSELDSVDGEEPPRRVMKTQSSEDPEDHDFEIVECGRVSLLDTANPNSRLTHFKEIAVEKGLDSQNYQCKGCSRPVGLIYGNPRVCSFDGGYYCFECHENDEYYIPAHIIFNWDFRKQKVSKLSQEYVQQMEDQPVLDLEELNPKIYDHIQEMEDVRLLRQQLCSLKTYLFTCHQSVAVDLRKKVWPREHLYDSRHLCSLSDLLQIPSGQLARFLKEVVKFASKHVYDCSLCSQKGFICEVCNNPKVIYPFEVESTYRCMLCKAVYHKTCMTENLPCPKCLRWRLRKSSFGASPADSEDYAFTPP